MNLDLDILQ